MFVLDCDVVHGMRFQLRYFACLLFSMRTEGFFINGAILEQMGTPVGVAEHSSASRRATWGLSSAPHDRGLVHKLWSGCHGETYEMKTRLQRQDWGDGCVGTTRCDAKRPTTSPSYATIKVVMEGYAANVPLFEDISGSW